MQTQHSFFFSVERSALMGIMNGIILVCFAHSTGFLVITTYAVHIFNNVGVIDIDPYVSSITIAIVQLGATLCTTTFSDTLGRRVLLIISFLGSAFGLLSFASYSYFKQFGYELKLFEWVPVASLSFVIFTSSAGVVPLFSLVTVENLTSKVSVNEMQLLESSTIIVSNFCNLRRFEPLASLYAMYS